MSTILMIMLYLAGAATSIGVHEGAHMAVAEIQGVRLEWDGGSWTAYPQASDSLRMAGVIAQAVTSEIILAGDLQDRSPFFRGLLHANILHAGSYAALRGGTGDFQGIGERWSRGVAFHAAWTAARTFREYGGVEVRSEGIFYTWRW